MAKSIVATITGGRNMKLDDYQWINDFVDKLLEPTLKDYGVNCIVSGCDITGTKSSANISSGLVYINSKFYEFDAVAGANFTTNPTQYFNVGSPVNFQRTYADAALKNVATETKAVLSATNTPPNIVVTFENNAMRLVDLFGGVPNFGTASVASATNISIPHSLEYVEISGTTTINTISISKGGLTFVPPKGKRLIIKFLGALTLTNNSADSGNGRGLTLPNGNYSILANNVIEFVFNGSKWDAITNELQKISLATFAFSGATGVATDVTGTAFTLPSAGTYEIGYSLNCLFAQANYNTFEKFVTIVLRNTTDSTDVTESSRNPVYQNSAGSDTLSLSGNASFMSTVTITSSKSFILRVTRVFTGTPVNSLDGIVVWYRKIK